MHRFTQPPEISELLRLSPQLKYLLWDMDGTLLNTEILHTKASLSIVSEQHPEDCPSYEFVDNLCLGRTDQDCLKAFQELDYLKILNLSEFIELKFNHIKKIILSSKKDTVLAPSVLNLLKECQKHKIKLAIVTSSERDLTDLILKQLDLTHFFDLILTREDTIENKPSPMPYLSAMNHFKASTNECFIFEDSPTGLQAASKSTIAYGKACWY